MKLLSTKQIVATYGNPGIGEASPRKAWERASIVTCRDGNGDRPGVPGVPPRFYFMVHQLAEPAMRIAFAAAKLADPGYTIERAGAYNFRHQRHDPARPLSRHSWGIAVDIDAEDNSGRQFAAGKSPAPWSAAWLEVWPRGLSRAFVEAFEAEGFVWGGRWLGFVDPMHFEIGAPSDLR